MPNNSLYKFFFSIVVPSILAILLFIVSFFVIIIPQFEKNLMEAKKETIRELTQSAWSVLNENYESYKDSTLSLSAAQEKAAHQVEKMRYGSERKDYFWIINMHPKMIMHPYKPELVGSDLSNYTDSHENKLFVEAMNIVKENGDGFIDYYWQWKDDTTRIVPKLSYVKGFNEWNWVIGTGIYLEDVREEIAQLKNRLLFITIIIILLIIATWIYVIRQSLKIEYKRRSAEKNLRLSRQKYKSLVEASTDGTLMIVNQKIIYSNLKLSEITGFYPSDLYKLNFDDLFEINWENVVDMFKQPNRSFSIDTRLYTKDKQSIEVVVTASKVDYSGEEGFIVIVKDVSNEQHLDRESKILSADLELNLLQMSRPISSNIHEHTCCSPENTIAEVAEIMVKRQIDAVFVVLNNSIIGIINDKDIRSRAIAKNINPSSSITGIMSSPVIKAKKDILLFEALHLFNVHKISHLLIVDSNNNPFGMLSRKDALFANSNTLSALLHEIKEASVIEQLKIVRNKIPALVNALLNSGNNMNSISGITSAISDRITIRLIDMAIENIGEPPGHFAFIAMGSEGRKEETLYTDQDNAIIFDDQIPKESAYDYFSKLANKVNNNLHIIGYNKCKGNIMAMNPKWCQPLSEWKSYFSKWTKEPDPQSILDSSIFFDFRHIYGKDAYIDQLRSHIASETDKNGLFFYHMADSMNKFKAEQGENIIDLKRFTFPLIQSIRIMAIKENLSETNTLKRLVELEKNQKIFLPFKNLKRFYEFLFLLRLRTQTKAIMNHDPADNMVDLSTLSELDRKIINLAQNEIQKTISIVTNMFQK